MHVAARPADRGEVGGEAGPGEQQQCGVIGAEQLAPVFQAREDVGELHDITNVSDAPAISIHGYSPPLTAMTFWRRSGAGLVPDHTVRGTAEELVVE